MGVIGSRYLAVAWWLATPDYSRERIPEVLHWMEGRAPWIVLVACGSSAKLGSVLNEGGLS